MRHWLSPSDDPQFDAKVDDVHALHRAALALAQRGERVVSTDELTGVQALERARPDLPVAPGLPRYREFEYVRHGTRSFLLNRDVASGQVFAPSCGPTRTEADFAAHIAQTVASDPTASRWHFVVDNLDIHGSAALVRYVAQRDGLEVDLGRKGRRGILARVRTRAAFLSDPTHTIVFHSTPTHASWLNQIEPRPT